MAKLKRVIRRQNQNNTRRMSPASIGGGFHLRTSVAGTPPHRRPQELRLPARVDGVARSNQASLLELRSWLNTPDKQEMILDDYYEEWIERKKCTVKEVTPYRYGMWYRNQISPVFGKVGVNAIHRQDIYRFQQNLARQYHPNTVNYIIRMLRMILADAVADELLERNPAEKVRPIRNNRLPVTETNHRALTTEEQELFMGSARKSFYYEFYALLLLTGMRHGEAAALTWEDLDEEGNVIRVRRTLSLDQAGHVIIGPTKTAAGIRDIPLTDSSREILERQKEKRILLHGREDMPRNSTIFCSTTGGILHNRTANRALKTILNQMEKEGTKIAPFTVHALRDTFATRFIEQGGSPQTLKTILGHSSLAMTMDLYSQVLPNTRQKEMDQLQILV